MYNTTRFMWQGLTQSIILLNRTTQPFTEDTPQAQGISVPSFRESCVHTLLT